MYIAIILLVIVCCLLTMIPNIPQMLKIILTIVAAVLGVVILFDALSILPLRGSSLRC